MISSGISNPAGEVLRYVKKYKNLHPKYFHSSGKIILDLLGNDLRNLFSSFRPTISPKEESRALKYLYAKDEKASYTRNESEITSYASVGSNTSNMTNSPNPNNLIENIVTANSSIERLDNQSILHDYNHSATTSGIDHNEIKSQHTSAIQEELKILKRAEEYENQIIMKRYKLKRICNQLNVPPDNLLIIAEWLSSLDCINMLETAYELRVNTLFMQRFIKDFLGTCEGFEGCIPVHTLTYLCMICNYVSIKDWDLSSSMILMEIMKRSRSIEESLQLIPDSNLSFINQHGYMIDDVGFQSSIYNYKSISFKNCKYFIQWRRVSDLVNRPSLFASDGSSPSHAILRIKSDDLNESTHYTDLHYNLESGTLLVILVCILIRLKSDQFEAIYFPQPYQPYHQVAVNLFDIKRGIKKREILCDDIVPCIPFHTPIGIYSQRENQVWPWILEKAISKMLGSYEDLWNATIESIVPLFTGLPIQTIDYGVWEILHYHYSLQKDFVILGTKEGPQAIIVEMIDYEKKLLLYEPRKKKHSWVHHDDSIPKITKCWIASTQNIFFNKTCKEF